MNLEQVLGNAIGGFSIGFGYGFYIDNKKGFYDETIRIRKERNNDKDAKSNWKSTFREMAYSYISGIALSYTLFNKDVVKEETLTGIISTYVGIQAGKAASKFRRNKRKPNDEDQQTIDKYLSDIRENIIKTGDCKCKEIQGDNKLYKIIEKYKNPNILNDFLRKSEESHKYGKFYLRIQKAVSNEEEISLYHLEQDMKDKASILILYNDMLYNAKIHLKESHAESSGNIINLNMKKPEVQSEKLEWNGTIDQLCILAMQKSDKGFYVAIQKIKGDNVPEIDKIIDYTVEAYAQSYIMNKITKKLFGEIFKNIDGKDMN